MLSATRDDGTPLACSSCGRYYELVRRYMRREGDFDFSPIPRLLPCLHTLCHSCLTEQWERDEQHVRCPLCQQREAVPSVYHLPLDISTLQSVVSSSGSSSFSLCARCYDDVPSVSWCESCSSALCAFHHQDHTLSSETAKHSIATFKELAYQGKRLEFHFPPLPCPQSPLQDCAFYCRDCMLCISAHALVAAHKSHAVQAIDSPELIEEATQAVKDAIVDVQSSSRRCKEERDRIKKLLAVLDKEEETTVLTVSKTFNALHAKLKKREKELLDKFSQGMQTQRKRLFDQLTLCVDSGEDCDSVAAVGKGLLRDTSGTATEKMYLVSASDTVEYRADSLCKEVEEMLNALEPIDPNGKIDFIEEDLLTIEGLIQRLGAVDIAEEEKEREKERRENDRFFAEGKNNESDEDDEDGEEVYFTVLVDESVQNVLLGAQRKNAHDSKSTKLRNDLSRVSLDDLGGNIAHSIVIEARLRRMRSWDSENNNNNNGESKADPEKDAKYVIDSGSSIDANNTAKRDKLVGRILLQEKIDSSVLEHCRMRRNFETVRRSVGAKTLPVLRIDKILEYIK